MLACDVVLRDRGGVDLFPVLYEDPDLLVLHKPAGLVCHPTKAGPYSSLVSRVRLHLGQSSELQMVHRLDRETSGVMIFGKSTAAAEGLRQLWLNGLVTKEYTALVHGHLHPSAGEIQAPLGPDERSAVAIKDCVRSDGAAARTRYRVERHLEIRSRPYSRLRLWLDTGRKHQIRIHLAHVGHALVGDKLYGGREQVYLRFVERRLTEEDRQFLELPFQALHAEWLWLPWAGVERGYNSAPEDWFTRFEAGAPVEWPTPDSDRAEPA